MNDALFAALLQAQGIAPPPEYPATPLRSDTDEQDDEDDEDDGARPGKRQRDETLDRDDQETNDQSDSAESSKTEDDKLNAFKVRHYNPRTLFLMFY